MTVEGFWQEIGRWAVSAASAIAIGFVAMIRLWVGSRFDDVDRKLDEQGKKLSEHDARLAAVDVHVEKAEESRKEIKESIKVLHSKMDRLLERTG